MKYLCMVFFEESKLDSLSREEFEDLVEQSLAYDDVLRAGGNFLAAHALQPVGSATTVRVPKGRVLITDGPFAETNEQIGGFLLIEAKDLNDALQIAAKIPVAALGGVEVRPVKEIKRMRAAEQLQMR